METIARQHIFEQNRIHHERGTHVAQTSLRLGAIAMHFSGVERVPRYANGERENDAEHSYMLALVAPELSESLELNLDTGLISQYAIVHDLIEIKTGDVATFLFTEDNQSQKELNEQAALRELARELPPHTATMLLRYESQVDPEARFVRYVDKLLPIVIDIIGSGRRVMEEDYGITDEEMLRRCHESLHERLLAKFDGEFPDLDIAHQLLCELFQTTYQAPAQERIVA